MQLNSNKLLLCISILLIPNFVLLQNEYTQEISCLVKIQSEGKNKWLVDIIKNSGDNNAPIHQGISGGA
jgi:hypothetical protein